MQPRARASDLPRRASWRTDHLLVVLSRLRRIGYAPLVDRHLMTAQRDAIRDSARAPAARAVLHCVCEPRWRRTGLNHPDDDRVLVPGWPYEADVFSFVCAWVAGGWLS